MRARTLLSFLNLAALTATFVVWFAFPKYAEYAVYLALAWTVVAVTLLFSSWVSHPVGAAGAAVPGAAPGGAAPGGAPTAPALPAGPIPFCIYCATDLPVGASTCPACGHPVRYF
jgi:hypothetical protein